jgi:hypothetical protein
VLFVLAAIAACASVFALCRLCCNACMSLPACHPARDEQEEVIEMPETGGEHQGQQQREEEQQQPEQPAISSKPRHELLRCVNKNVKKRATNQSYPTHFFIIDFYLE